MKMKYYFSKTQSENQTVLTCICMSENILKLITVEELNQIRSERSQKIKKLKEIFKNKTEIYISDIIRRAAKYGRLEEKNIKEDVVINEILQNILEEKNISENNISEDFVKSIDLNKHNFDMILFDTIHKITKNMGFPTPLRKIDECIDAKDVYTIFLSKYDSCGSDSDNSDSMGYI